MYIVSYVEWLNINQEYHNAATKHNIFLIISLRWIQMIL